VAERSGPTESELVRRWRAGDAAAAQILCGVLLPRLQQRARRAIRREMQGRVSPSDAVQEALVTASLRIEDFEDRGEGSFGRWLLQILDHKLKDEIRRHLGTRRRDARHEVGNGSSVGPTGTAASPTRSPGSHAAAAEQSARLRAAMDGLSASHRAVLRLVHEQGLSLAEVARVTARSPSAVSQLYGRAVTALARRLADTGSRPHGR
jgi:RNA polymerase sigma-70 factor, ECF subfamily